MSIPLFFFEISLFGVTLIAAQLYIVLIVYIIRGWNRTPEWKIPRQYVPSKFISVVIAARNEEMFLGQCIESILQCNYPKELFEIIVVNDHSQDATESIVKKYQTENVHLYSLDAEHGKKSALEMGISMASGEIIACTDADCLVPQNWLKIFGSCFEAHKIKALAGPISYLHDDSILQQFQFIDALNNMCVTANGITRKSYYMANGANFWFTKEVFHQVGGYHKKEQYASGDDMFLIQEIAYEYPGHVAFLKSKEAIVQTHPEYSFEDFISQRERWASKSKAYSNKNILRIQGFVFSFVMLLLLNLILGFLGSELSTVTFILALLFKLPMDYYYLSKLSNFTGDRLNLTSFIIVSFSYLPYMAYMGFKGLNPTKYKWKGRNTT